MDDDELIAAIASGDGGGDDTALRELFSRHAPWIAVRLRKALPPDDVEDVMARNVTGIGLLSSLVTGGLLAWILPMAYIAFAEYALLQSWTSPWIWPVRPPADRGAWLCACAVFAAGLVAFTIRGARTRLADDS